MSNRTRKYVEGRMITVADLIRGIDRLAPGSAPETVRHGAERRAVYIEELEALEAELAAMPPEPEKKPESTEAGSADVECLAAEIFGRYAQGLLVGLNPGDVGKLGTEAATNARALARIFLGEKP